jgi:hypothetical protein
MFGRNFDGTGARSGLAFIKSGIIMPANSDKGVKMDNGSRNIVKFIATITLAALLIMGVRYYAESQKQPMPSVAEEAVAPEKKSDSPPAPQPTTTPAPIENSEFQNDEEIPAITGEPSVDIAPGGQSEPESLPADGGN